MGFLLFALAGELLVTGKTAALIVLAIFGFLGIDAVEKSHGKDASIIVVDELIGFGIAILWIPFNWGLWIAAFFIFRFFDIFKPFFIDSLQKLKGGMGVILDDVLAGFYTFLVLRLLMYLEWF
jgi:phosphatidylglycerophosphatase A